MLSFSMMLCKSAGNQHTIETGQTEVVQPADDPFFTAPSTDGELFRVLITTNNYQIKQMTSETLIQRKPDPAGDRDQLEQFTKLHDRYAFRDWSLAGMLKIRLNPNTGEIEHIEFAIGHNPKSWQAGRMFQDDVSRFSFLYPQKVVQTHDFLIKYEWRIKRPEGMTDEQAKTRATEFLRSEVRR